MGPHSMRSRDLGLPPAVIGLLLAGGSVGALAGALLASAVVRRGGIGPSVIVGGLLAGRAVIARGLAGGPTGAGGILVAAPPGGGDVGGSLLHLNRPGP